MKARWTIERAAIPDGEMVSYAVLFFIFLFEFYFFVIVSGRPHYKPWPVE